MNCPKCGTSDVTRAAMEWAKGTTINVRKGSKPDSRRVRNMHQNLSAFKLSPPDKPKARFFLMILMGIVGLVIADNVPETIPALRRAISIAALILPIVWGIWEIGKRNERYGIALANWERLWFCNRCGEVSEEHHFAVAAQTARTMLNERQAANAAISDS